jgi:hypothetical protein
MTKMVARKSVVSGRREDPVVMVDSDSSESTGHYGEGKHADPSDDTNLLSHLPFFANPPLHGV